MFTLPHKENKNIIIKKDVDRIKKHKYYYQKMLTLSHNKTHKY